MRVRIPPPALISFPRHRAARALREALARPGPLRFAFRRWHDAVTVSKIPSPILPAPRRGSRRSIGDEMTEFPEARKVAALLAAVSEPTRLRVLWQLARGPMFVGALSEAVGIKMVNMSHHLGVMRQAGVLDDEKDGRKVVYKLNPE